MRFGGFGASSNCPKYSDKNEDIKLCAVSSGLGFVSQKRMQRRNRRRIPTGLENVARIRAVEFLHQQHRKGKVGIRRK
jgi:hypothetical protein